VRGQVSDQDNDQTGAVVVRGMSRSSKNVDWHGALVGLDNVLDAMALEASIARAATARPSPPTLSPPLSSDPITGNKVPGSSAPLAAMDKFPASTDTTKGSGSEVSKGSVMNNPGVAPPKGVTHPTRTESPAAVGSAAFISPFEADVGAANANNLRPNYLNENVNEVAEASSVLLQSNSPSESPTPLTPLQTRLAAVGNASWVLLTDDEMWVNVPALLAMAVE